MPPKRPQRRRNKRSGENRSTSVSENCNLTSGATSPSREQFDNTSDDPKTRSLEDVTTQQMEGEEEQDNQVSRTFEQATTSLVQDAAGDTQAKAKPGSEAVEKTFGSSKSSPDTITSDLAPKTPEQPIKIHERESLDISPSKSSEPADNSARRESLEDPATDQNATIRFYPTGGKSTIVTPAIPGISESYKLPKHPVDLVAAHSTEERIESSNEENEENLQATSPKNTPSFPTSSLTGFVVDESFSSQKDENGGNYSHSRGGVYATRILAEPVTPSSIFNSLGRNTSPFPPDQTKATSNTPIQEEPSSHEVNEFMEQQGQRIGDKQKGRLREIEKEEEGSDKTAGNNNASGRWKQWSLVNPNSKAIQIVDDLIEEKDQELRAELSRLEGKAKRLRDTLTNARIEGMDSNAVKNIERLEKCVDEAEEEATMAQNKLEGEKKTTKILSARIEVQNVKISELEEQLTTATARISSNVEGNDSAVTADQGEVAMHSELRALENENNSLKELLQLQRSETGTNGDWQVIKYMIEHAIGEDEAARNMPMPTSKLNTPVLSPYTGRSKRPVPLSLGNLIPGAPRTPRTPRTPLTTFLTPKTSKSAQFAHLDISSEISEMPDLTIFEEPSTIMYKPSEAAYYFIISIESVDLRIERIQLALRHFLTEHSRLGVEEHDCANILALTFEGLDMARQLDYSVGVARILFWLGIVQYCNQNITEALAAFDQADKVVNLLDEEKLWLKEWRRRASSGDRIVAWLADYYGAKKK